MEFLKKIRPEWPLRLGLGLMFLYSGYDIFYHSSSWLWAVPTWFSRLITPVIAVENYLMIQGAGEFVMGLLFLAWFSGKRGVRVAAVLASVEMAAILLFTGVDLVTFRDLGVLGAALALVILVFREPNGTISND